MRPRPASVHAVDHAPVRVHEDVRVHGAPAVVPGPDGREVCDSEGVSRLQTAQPCLAGGLFGGEAGVDAGRVLRVSAGEGRKEGRKEGGTHGVPHVDVGARDGLAVGRVDELQLEEELDARLALTVVLADRPHGVSLLL